MYRYMPIHIEESDLGNISTSLYKYPKISLQLSEFGTGNTSLSQESLLANITPALVYVLLVALAAFMVYVILIYLRHKYSGPMLFSVVHKTSKSLGDITIDYSYEGIAKILREVFLNIRNRLCKPYCTPREIALKYSSSPLLQLFAKVYEDVVYGSKERDDVGSVVAEVMKYFAESK